MVLNLLVINILMTIFINLRAFHIIRKVRVITSFSNTLILSTSYGLDSSSD